MKSENSKTNMLEHSQAKVELYGVYLATYLNILSRVPSVQRIFIFDLLCGEGKYENGAKGSPLIALEVIKNHLLRNNSYPNITIWFNDNGLSKIEPNVYKIDRVKRFAKEIFIPGNVQIEYKSEDYDEIHPQALKEICRNPKAKGLFFIDPYGYKDIKPEDIRNILEPRNTEALLFLPTSFMYRFAEKASKSSFPGSEHLHGFLKDMFGDNVPRFSSAHDFVRQVKERFRFFFSQANIYVDTFIIERGHGLVYSLFFFTSNILGFEKMIEAKWKMDEEHGQGHSQQKTMSLFSEIEMSDYPAKLENFIRSINHRTNQELYCFGLENGFLPKHTKQVLDSWKKNELLELVSLDGGATRGYYLSHKHDRIIGFKLRGSKTKSN